MKQTLYDISQEYLELSSLLDSEDDEAVRNTLELVEHNLGEKVDNICGLLIDWSDTEDTIAAEIKRLQDRKKVYANRRQRLKNYLKFELERLNKPSLETDLHTVSVRKGSESVVVDDIDLIPDKYVKVVRTADKAALKKAGTGRPILAGWHLERGDSYVVIK